MTTHTDKERQLLHIVDAAIGAVSPDPAMRAAMTLDGDRLTVDGQAYDLSRYDRVLAIGAGKASAAMARTLEDILGGRLAGGVVATKYDHGLPLDRIEVVEAAHPVPDLAGTRASARLLELAADTTERDLVLVLLSGGASAIVPAPRPSITLEDKQEATRRLLECGATINEINAIRKHLSAFKGGHLAKALEPATVVTLIISDVVGDSLDVIGSGPTAPDESTFLDCQAILDKYSLCSEVPAAVARLIADGCAGREAETCKAGDSCFDRVRNVIIAGNGNALDGAARAAGELGYEPLIVDRAMQGEAREVARQLVSRGVNLCREGSGPVCLLAGGETTVTIRGTGTGGRNQELALAAAVELAGQDGYAARMSVLSLGTDGSDGPTDAAGALVFPDTVPKTEMERASARAFLDNNDAYTYFTEIGTILKTGPTRTNVMDVVALLIDPQ